VARCYVDAVAKGEAKKGKSVSWVMAFNALERLALFSLSVAIGLVDLAVAVFVAAYLGVIPKDKLQKFRDTAERVPVVGRLFEKSKPAPKPAAVKKKAAPASGPK
jgi:hypothetical protein